MTLVLNLATIVSMLQRSLPFLALLVFFGANYANAEVTTTVIRMYDDRYEPADVSINFGDTVSFVNAGTESRWPASNIHPSHRGYPNSDITNCSTEQASLMFDACTEVEPGESYSFTFSVPGAWRYHDHLKANIGGTITVAGTESAETNAPVSWLSTLWNKTKEIFVKLFGRASSATTETPPASEPSTETVTTDIAADDVTIFTDRVALHAYVKKFGAEKSLVQLHALSSSQVSCHDTAHYVGRYAYEESGTEAFSQCGMLCQSGCYHGAVEAYFREHGTSDLANSMNTLCEGITNDFVLHQCRHGVGHGLMAWSNYELFDALDGCGLLSDDQAKRSCNTGVFMENFGQSMASYLGIERHTTNYLNDDPHFPCSIVAATYQPDCYFLQTDRMLQLAAYDVATVDKNCSEVADGYSRTMCYRSLGRSIAGVYVNDPHDSYWACKIVEGREHRNLCLMGVVDNSFWDKTGAGEARTLCETMNLPEEKDMCYQRIFASALAVMDSFEEQTAFCGTIETTYKDQCVLAVESTQPGSTWDNFNEFR